MRCFLTGTPAFAYICNPIARYAERRLLRKLSDKPHLARILSLCLTYLFVIAILAILLFMIVPQIVNNYQDFSDNISRYINLLITQIDTWIRDSGLFGADYDGLLTVIHPEDIAASISSALGWLTGQLGQLGLQLLETTGVVLLGTILSVYILYYKERIAITLKRISLAVFSKKIHKAIVDSLHFADRARLSQHGRKSCKECKRIR